MESYSDNFNIKSGVRLYRNDLIKLEELLKYGDISTEYGVRYTDDNVFIYTVDSLIDNRNASYTFGSMAEVTSEHENIDIDYLRIEKVAFGKDSLKQRLELTIHKNYISISLMGRDLLWIKSQRLLLEDFFNQRKSKSGIYNNWISEKLHWYSSVIVGAFVGAGFGFNIPLLIIVGGLLFILSGIITYPNIKNKIFPRNQISLKEKDKKGTKEKEESKIRSIIRQYLPQVVSGIIASFIFYWISKLFE